MDYIFEYFNNYLNITEVEHQTILNNERLDAFRKQLREYDKDIQDWLVNIYNEYGKYMHRIIGNILNENDIFLFYNTESEFRSDSYDCYSKLIRKYPFLKEQTEMLFLFIKDYHRVKSISVMKYIELPFFTQAINDWIDKTQAKYNVSIPAFAYTYIFEFSETMRSGQ